MLGLDGGLLATLYRLVSADSHARASGTTRRRSKGTNTGTRRMAFPATVRASVLRCALSCLLLGGLVTGCASSNDAAKLINPDPPDKMYARADALLNSGNFTEAAKKFEDLDRDHPYAPEARRAIVMAAYAY